MTGKVSPWKLAPMLALFVALPLAGCVSDREALVVPEGDSEGLTQAGDVDESFLARLFAVLTIDTTDPAQWYADGNASPWFQYSTITNAESFNVRVTNQGRSAARNVQLLVAVPGDLPDVGWSVTIGSPAVVLSSLDDFPHERLLEAHYPWLPHQVYRNQGNARFMILNGPKVLPPGKTWEVPVQLFRGSTANFMVHFDATGWRAFSGPRADVTAEPPFQDSGERLAPGGVIG